MDRFRPVMLVTFVMAAMAAVAVLVVWTVWVAFAPTPADLVRTEEIPATLGDLTGPWRAAPMRLDPATAAKADRACRGDSEFPVGLRLVLVDARGGGRLPTIYEGGDKMADCVYTEIGADGDVVGSLSSTGSTSGQAMPGPGKLWPLGGGSSESGSGAWTYSSGRVGPGITAVVVDVAGIGPITATVQNGWYLAWWQGAPPRGGPPQPRTATAFDAFGTRLDQVVEVP